MVFGYAFRVLSRDFRVESGAARATPATSRQRLAPSTHERHCLRSDRIYSTSAKVYNEGTISYIYRKCIGRLCVCGRDHVNLSVAACNFCVSNCILRFFQLIDWLLLNFHICRAFVDNSSLLSDSMLYCI